MSILTDNPYHRMLKRLFTLLLIGSFYLPMFVQAFGSHDLRLAVHATATKHTEQSGHEGHHHHDDIEEPSLVLDNAQPEHLVILPLLSENHESSRVVLSAVKADLDDGDKDNDSDNHSTAVLTDYAYGRAFSPPLVAPNPSLFHPRFSQRDLFLQTQRLRI